MLTSIMAPRRIPWVVQVKQAGKDNRQSVFIDREAREIMYLVASVRPSVRPSVRLWGSALLSAVKSNRSHYQSKVFVCVSIISRRMRIIARMRSIGF